MIEMKAGNTLATSIAKERNVFFYMVKGQAAINGQTAAQMSLVEFKNDGEEITVTATEDCLILLGHALPYKEPVVSHGPFVMNTEAEIRQAFTDYQAGKMGVWQ